MSELDARYTNRSAPETEANTGETTLRKIPTRPVQLVEDTPLEIESEGNVQVANEEILHPTLNSVLS